MDRDHTHHQRTLFDDIVASAIGAGTPPSIAEEARRATASHLSGALIGHRAYRARAYFWGVVRQRVLAGEAPRLTRSLLAASLAEDLAEAGHPPDVVRHEVAREYGPETAQSDRSAIGRNGRAA